MYKKYGGEERGRKYGNKISAYISSIGQNIEEYLVIPEHLEKTMKDVGFTLEKSFEFEKLYQEMIQKHKDDPKMKLAVNMTDDEKDLVFTSCLDI